MAGEWRNVTVQDIAADTASGPFGSNIKSAEYVTTGVPVIRGINLVGPRFLTDNFVYVSEEKASQLSSSLAYPEDIVFSARGTIGNVGIVPSEPFEKYILSSNLIKLSVDRKKAEPLYIFYYFRSSYGQREIHSYVSTTGVPKIARALESLRKFHVFLPPLPEQRAIAHILGTLDDKIELNRRMSETLEQMARAIFKAWFVDFEPVRAKMEGRWRRGQSLPGLPAHLYDLFPDRLVDSELGEIPEGWEVKKLGDVCEKPQYGYTASASDHPVGPRFLRITDINKHDWIDWDDVPFCSIEPDKKAKYALAPGDIVIARIADPGHGALIEELVDAVFASYLIRFRPRRPELARYLQYWLRSDQYWDTVRSRQSGTTRANLNAQVLRNFELLLPDADVLKMFNTIVGSLRDRVVANVRESRTLAALRDLLLPKLISGELRVKDAERFLEECGL